jgi:hypothetical protein
MKNRPCYHCGAPATSTEHVPPKCIFPEKKDAFGANYRRNLNTKLRRTFGYRDSTLLRRVMPDAKPATLTLPDGTKLPILFGQANMPRLVSALESVARGLFHARHERFIGKVYVMPMFIRLPHDADLTFTQQFAALSGRWGLSRPLRD